jgi:hypothetical protein
MSKVYDNPEHMMEAFGGSFVKALVHLWYCADSTNKARLRAAFADYFERYEKLYEAQKASTQVAA